MGKVQNKLVQECAGWRKASSETPPRVESPTPTTQHVSHGHRRGTLHVVNAINIEIIFQYNTGSIYELHADSPLQCHN